jgi:ribose transport system substrate-binding protein
MKKVLALVVVLVMLAALFTACSTASEQPSGTTEASQSSVASESTPSESAQTQETYLIGVSQRWGTVPFLRTIAKGIQDSAAEWEKNTGVKIELIITDSGNDDPTQQIKDMENLYNQQVDGLILFPGDSKVCSDPVKNIYNANNVPVVVTDIGLDYGEYVSMLITDNKAAGEMAAEEMAKIIPAGGKVVAFNHALGNNNVTTRIDGFRAKAEELGLTVLPDKPVEYSVDGAIALTEDVLTAEPDIAGIFTVNQLPAYAAGGALKDAGNTTCKVVGFDLDGNALESIKTAGTVSAYVVQDPYYMGYEGLNQMMYYLTGQTDKIVKDIPVVTKLLTMDNVADFENDPQVTFK